MKLHEVKNRVPELDTKVCICINNHLWNREKVQFINGGKQFLAPKYYAPRHITQVKREKLIRARVRAMNPLKHLRDVKPTKPKWYKPKELKYNFHAYYLSEEQYNQLYGFFYSKIKPNGRRTIKTVEQIDKLRKKKK